MTKADLLKLPRKKLAEIAEQFSLDLDDYDSKEEFIDELFEIVAEETQESLKANNTVSQIRQKKFVLNQELSLGLRRFGTDGSDDSALFVNTFFKAILRDNQWVFVLWQISNIDSMNYKLDESDYRMVIRVVECDRTEKGLSVVDDFEIPVKPADSTRYINLPHQDRYYYMELFCVRENSRVMLARTNTVFSPRLRVDNLGDFVNIDSLLISNKIYESVIFPPEESGYASQKIIRD
ncbi:MAG: DUF4912 domain-containing protein [Spirochaetia bacterium]|nr:DUF4912 domain-containing protein [Spirochaetia bacterium]